MTLAQLRRVAPAERAAMLLADVAIPIADVPTATRDIALVSLLERLPLATGGRALVFDTGNLVGIVTPIDIARAVEVRTLGHVGSQTAEERTATVDWLPGIHRSMR